MNNKLYQLIIIASIIAMGFLWFQKSASEKREFNTNQKFRKERIAKDKLQIEKDGLVIKLVADTLELKQLRKVITDLGINIKNPKIAQEIIFIPKDTITIIKEIEIRDTILSFTDYYPQKENYFTRHITRFDTKNTTATGEYNFNPITISLGIGEQEDGTYKVITKLPEYFDIKSVDVQSLPIREPEKDNWGILLGADYIQNLDTKQVDLGINSFVRYKKTYFGLGATTNKDLRAGIKFEF